MKPMLLCDYVGTPVNGWLMSEKYDGWRAIWDGSNFYSRELGLLDAPDWFKDGMPHTALDGEIWAGRGEFYSIQAMMKNDWRGLRFMVFDAPDVMTTYRDRVGYIGKMMLPVHVERALRFEVQTVEQVIQYADHVVSNGGEGVVVRDPNGLYHAGKRSRDVLRWVPQDPEINRRKLT